MHSARLFSRRCLALRRAVSGVAPARGRWCSVAADLPSRAEASLDRTSAGTAEQIAQHMRKDIRDLKVVLFMKGEPEAPKCGFSSQAVDVLQSYGVTYVSYNALSHPGVRMGVKEISGWPFLPQMFVNGEFVGGGDVLAEMHRTGQLSELLRKGGVAHRDPKTGISFMPDGKATSA
eukprot:TRINITY_DN30751_c0_g1_i1.p1 TRINITY_DN30751_c0_g1~~TRINITY_DN30751_c0_g1_i1.p1  ORF type:complete len:194 (+),score=55.51 TRINITY_DN30751_c0_g1_i1:56-583(+)